MKKSKREEDKLNLSLRTIAKSSIIIFACIMISKLLTYTFRVIAARHYGPEAYGLFSLATMVVGWFVVFASFGFLESLVRFIPYYRGKEQLDKARFAVKFVSILILISGIISAVLLFFLSNYISLVIFKNASLISFLKISSVIIFLTMFSTLYINILRAYEKVYAYSLIYNILQSITRLTALLVFIFLGLGAKAIIVAYLTGLLIAFITAYLFCRIKLPEIFSFYNVKGEEKRKIVKEMFSYSWPTIFQAIIASILLWIDSFSIGYFRTVAEVGIYNAAIPIALLLGMTTDLFMQLFFPMVNREYGKGNIELVRNLAKQVGKWVLTINLPVFFVMLVFPGAVINILFGAEYLPGELSLRLLAIGNFTFALAMISYYLLLIGGRTRMPLFNTLFAAALNLVLNLWLVPKYGISGAAFSTMLCLIFLTVLYTYEAKKYITASPFSWGMIKVLILSIIPLAFLIIVRNFVEITLIKLIIIGLIFMVLYYCVMFFCGGFDEKDKMIISRIKDKLFIENPIVSYFFGNQ